MEDTITIKGKWTVESLAEYMRPANKPPKFGIEQWGLSALLILIGITLTVLAWWMRHAEALMGIGICTALTGIGGLAWQLQPHVFPKYHWRMQAQRHLRASPALATEMTITLGTNGITCINTDGKVQVAWHGCNSYQKTQKAIHLPIHDLIIPRAWVADDAAWKAIEDFLEKKIASSGAAKDCHP